MRRALAYFERNNIDIRHPPVPGSKQNGMPVRAEGLTTEACTIDLAAYLLYAHLEVVTASGHRFEGHSYGAGAGDLVGAGVIYYSDLGQLLATGDFGVVFAAEDGGVMQITWGKYGNATLAGVGEGFGGFGGSGSWS